MRRWKKLLLDLTPSRAQSPWLRVLALSLLLITLAACDASTPSRAQLLRVEVFADNDGLQLELTQELRLTERMRQALAHGIPLRLRYRVSACGAQIEHALWLRYAPLDARYELQREGDLEVRGFARLAGLIAALDRVRLPLGLPPQARCGGYVRLDLDQAALPTPLRLPALMKPEDWRLQSPVRSWAPP